MDPPRHRTRRHRVVREHDAGRAVHAWTPTLEYTFTVTDPETWTSAWTASMPMRRNDLTLFEYACHEGNYSMEGILAGARADEKAAAHAATQGSR